MDVPFWPECLHVNFQTNLFVCKVTFTCLIFGSENKNIQCDPLPAALSGTESRIARFPESRAWNRQKFHSEKPKNESNRSNSIQNRHSNRILPMLKATLESHDSNRTILKHSILDSESPTQCHQASATNIFSRVPICNFVGVTGDLLLSPKSLPN